MFLSMTPSTATDRLYRALCATEGTDTLDNPAVVSCDTNYCEEALFQVQRRDGDPDPPRRGARPRRQRQLHLQTTIPMEDVASSTVTITEPASLAQSWLGNITSALDVARERVLARQLRSVRRR